MMGKLYDLVQLVKQDGDILSVSRLSLKCLEITSKHGIKLSQVTPSTECNDSLLEKVKKEAELILEKEITL